MFIFEIATLLNEHLMKAWNNTSQYTVFSVYCKAKFVKVKKKQDTQHLADVFGVSILIVA